MVRYYSIMSGYHPAQKPVVSLTSAFVHDCRHLLVLSCRPPRRASITVRGIDNNNDSTPPAYTIHIQLFQGLVILQPVKKLCQFFATYVLRAHR